MERGNETDAVELAALLDAGDGATVTLAAGGTRLVAHRAVLAARSPVFASMFRRGTPEARSGRVSIADVEGHVLRHLLAYMYTLQVPQLPNMAAEMLSAADRYGLPGLKGVCEQQVVAQLSVENAVATVVLAERCCCPTLKQAAVAFIQAHAQQVVKTRGWEDSALSHPHSFLELTRLIIEPPSETSAPATRERRPKPGAQLHSDHGRHAPATAAAPTAARHAVPPDGAAAISRIREPLDSAAPWPSSESVLPRRVSLRSAPITAESATTAGTPPQRDHGRSAGAAAKCNTRRGTPPPGEAAVSRVCAPDVAEAGSTPSARPHGDHGRSPAPPAQLTATRRAAPPEDAAASRLRWVPQEEKSRRLIGAAQRGAVEDLQALIVAGAEVEARDVKEWTALHWAAARGHLQVVRRLVESGAQVDARTSQQSTPLHMAAASGHAPVVQLLVASRADPNAADQWQKTPLHWAAKRGHTEAAAALLTAGADRWARSNKGKTPLHLARQNNHQQLAELLT